jgi:hypothetical protein
VISSEPQIGLNPNRLHFRGAVSVQKCICEGMASPAREEYPFR